MTQGLEIDRRTLMQASGVAGAGALGLGAVTADPDDDHYVVASDTHLGSPYSDSDEFETFLTTDVPELDPDVLVLAGDAFEMWFRGIGSALLEFSNVADRLATLQDNGTDVALVAGNHDRRLVTVGEGLDDEIAPGEPWTIGEEFFFQSGDTEFVAVHGDGPDPIQLNPVSRTLCDGTDALGAILLILVGWWEGMQPWAPVGETGSVTATGKYQSVSLSGSYEDPVVLTSQPAAGGPVQTRTAAGLADGTGSFQLRLDGARQASPVQYAVFERGRHVLGGGTAVEASRTSAGDDWQTVTFEEPFGAAPVVFATVQTTLADRPRARRDARDSREADVSVPQIRNVTEMGFEVRIDGDAEVGFAAVERGDITTRGRHGVAGVDSVEGTDAVGFDRAFADTPAVFAAPQAATGGPAVAASGSVGPAATEVSLQTADGTPASGAVGYLALTGDGPLHASTSSTVPTPDLERRFRSEWQRRLDASDEYLGSAVPEQPPTMAGLEPMATGHEDIKNALLEKYEEFVLFGHTHVPDLGDRYANTGSWTDRSPDSEPQRTYVEIIDGDATVWDWSPDGREKLYD
jgi:predicted phosphodiesterase